MTQNAKLAPKTRSMPKMTTARNARNTTLVFHAFRAGVVFGIERACGTGFAFCLFCTVLGDEFLARSALGDYHACVGVMS